LSPGFLGKVASIRSSIRYVDDAMQDGCSRGRHLTVGQADDPSRQEGGERGRG